MGKDLRGREIGRCLTQRTDGLYCARIRVHGKDYCKYFTKLKEAKEWVSTAQFEIDCGNIYASNLYRDPWNGARTQEDLRKNYQRPNQAIVQFHFLRKPFESLDFRKRS